MKENKKKTYERPQLQVFALQKQVPIICTSGGGLNNPGGLENGGDPFASGAPSLDDEDILF